jgi:predicted nucleotidyltransferase
MTRNSGKMAGGKTVLGTKVSGKVADLLVEIEKEPVPDRLFDLALQLQKALNDKLDAQG